LLTGDGGAFGRDLLELLFEQTLFFIRLAVDEQ
jgi:hypothetical protein